MYGPRDLRIEEVEVPEPKGNQVLIRVAPVASAVRMLSVIWANRKGRYDLGKYTPGHSGAAKLSKSAKASRTQSRHEVTGDCVMACGYCRNCKTDACRHLSLHERNRIPA